MNKPSLLLPALLLAVCGAPAHTSDASADEDLCKLLDARQVSAVLGSERSVGKGSYGGCVYSNPQLPDLHLLHSGQSTREKHVDLIRAMGGECKGDPNGSAFCSLGFDLKKGKVSSIWFLHGEEALEIQADDGLDPNKAQQLLKQVKL